MNPDDLVRRYLPYAKRLARRRWIPENPARNQEDAEQDAALGLLEAAAKYDERSAVGFEGYATKRIRGEVVDGQRRMDPVPRSIRRLQARLVAGAGDVRDSEGRTATWSELADTLGLTDADRLALAAAGPQRSLDAPATDDGAVLGELVADPAAAAGGRDLERIADDAWIAALLGRIRPRYQYVLRARYFQQMTLAEVAEILDVTESRVSQIQTDALEALRKETRETDW